MTMSITVEPFQSGPQKAEFFSELMPALNRAWELAKEHGVPYALFGEDHDLEMVGDPR